MFGESLRAHFPLFQTYPGLAYLDNAATTQKPAAVIRAIVACYEEENANIHRGIYQLAAKATARYEGVRDQVAAFLHAQERESILFTRGATEGINMVAQRFLPPRLSPGDEVLITAMEHHANLVPWQVICRQQGARLVVVPVSDAGELDLHAYAALLSARTRMVATVHISNTLGTINPIREMIAQAHERGIPVLIDAAQSVAHYALDVQALDCDFLVFSGHKLYGPTGTGVLYGKREYLEEMSPWLYGGDMIRQVSYENTTFAPMPRRLEAGTPNLAGIAGLGAAIGFIQAQDAAAMRAHLHDLGAYVRQQLAAIPGLRIIGEAAQGSGIVSFVVEHIHPHDIATFLDHSDIAVRAGHHCTQPLMDRLGIHGTARASFALYNTRAEIDRLVAALHDMIAFFV